MRFITVTDLHNGAINFISHDIVAILTNIGFRRIMSSRSISLPTPICEYRYSVRMCKSMCDLSSSPTSSQHLSCDLCLYNKPFCHAETLPARVHVYYLMGIEAVVELRQMVSCIRSSIP
jgi:hypothetical protein